MLTEIIGAFSAGTALGFSLGSPTEWAIHKYILHALPRSRKRNSFIDAAARGHNDRHHGAYKAPAHYYRDITNEHEIIHFAKSDVGLIAGISTLIGAGINQAHAALSSRPSVSLGNAAFVGGFLTGTMTYYGCYEIFHHYMHVIGQRRLAINRVIGDLIQGGEQYRDGNLRVSKPLLDDICNETEAIVDQTLWQENKTLPISYSPALIERLYNQIKVNIECNLTGEKPVLALSPEKAAEILIDTSAIFAEKEKIVVAALSPRKRFRYAIQRMLDQQLRTSQLFKYLDNHHFIHHQKYGKNLNVLVPCMDYICGTKAESSSAMLESNTRYWLCPNSPEVKAFFYKEAA
jgi:hypothetical protein